METNEIKYLAGTAPLISILQLTETLFIVHKNYEISVYQSDEMKVQKKYNVFLCHSLIVGL